MPIESAKAILLVIVRRARLGTMVEDGITASVAVDGQIGHGGYAREQVGARLDRDCESARGIDGVNAPGGRHEHGAEDWQGRLPSVEVSG